MGYSDCKYCKKYMGDCGNHLIDSKGHINYECPSVTLLNEYNEPTCFIDIRTKYKELYNRMNEEGIEDYRFSDKEDFYNVLRALLKMDEIERSNR